MAIRHRQTFRPIITPKFLSDEQTIIYLNRATGSDSNSGTFASPKLTLDGARLALPSTGGKILVSGSTESSFVQGFVDFSSGDVTIEGLNGQTWYLERTLTLSTGGWTSSGGGIYHRAGTSASGSLWYSSLQDSNGLVTILTQNTGTPSTPSEGEFGYVTNELYVHLPGSVDANNYTFKRASTNYLVQASSTCKLTIKNMIASYSNGSIVQLTSANARLTLENCDLRYGGNGISDSAASRIICRNVYSYKQTNDGFNANNGFWFLYNCEGAYNLDEGLSPHNTCIINIWNSYFHHNGHGGCTAINTSMMNIFDSICDNNGVNAAAGIEANGINYANTATGTIRNTVSSNNNRSGFYRSSSGTAIVFENFHSGLENGNDEVDVLG